MKTTASPSALLEVLEQAQHLRLDHHVERRRRLVGDQQPRLAGQREPDEHALALAAGELVRVVVRAPRRQADELEQLAHARARGARARLGACSRIASPICRPMRWTGFSVCSAPWKTIASSVQRTARSRPGFIVSTSSPSSRTSPVTCAPRGSSRSSAPASDDLPQPDSPARPSVSPTLEVEVDAAHGRHARRRACRR